LNYPKTIDGMCDFLGFGKYGVRRWARSRALNNGFPELANERVSEVVNSISGSGNTSRMNYSDGIIICNGSGCLNQVDGTTFLGYCETCLDLPENNPNSESQRFLSTVRDSEGELMASPTSVSEAILVLENDYDYYVQIRNAIVLYRSVNVEFGRIDLHHLVNRICDNHEHIRTRGFRSQERGQFIGAIIRHFLNHFTNLENE